jgi:hypothetical protein
MSQQHNRFEVKVLPHAVEVGEVGGEGDIRGLHVSGGAAPPALVVVDETVGIREAVEFRQEIAMVEIGSAVEDDNSRALPDFAGI